MSSTAPATPLAPRRRRWPVRLAVAACVLALAVLAGWLTRNRWLVPWLGRQLCAQLEQATGARVTLEELTWVALGEVELRQLRVQRDDPLSAPLDLELRLARARFSPVAAVRGAPDWLTAVELEGLRLALRPGPAAEDTAREPAPETSTWSLPARLPSLSLRDVTLDLDTGDLTVEAQDAGVVLSSRADDASGSLLRVSFDRFRLKRAAEVPLEGALEARIGWTAPRLEIETLSLDGRERLRGSWLDVPRSTEEALRWRADLAVCNGWIDIAGSVGQGDLELDASLAGVELQPLLRLILAENAPDLAGTLDGKLQLRHEARRAASLRIAFAGRAQEFAYAERKLDELAVDAEYEGSTLRARTLSARLGRDRLEARQLVLPFEGTLHDLLRAARGSVDLDVSDLPGWLRVEPPKYLRPPPPHRLELSMQLSADGLALERGLVITAGGRLDVRPSSIAWGPPDDPLGGARIEVGLDADFEDLSGLGALLDPEIPWRGSLRGRLALSGTGRSLGGRCDLEGRAVDVAGWALGELRARATIDAHRLVVEELVTSGALGVSSLRGGFDLQTRHLEDVEVSLCTDALPALLPAQLRGGELELEARLDGALLDPRGDITARVRGLVPATVPIQAPVDAECALRIEPGRLSFSRVTARSGQLTLEARGAIEHAAWRLPFHVEVEQLAVREAALDLALEAPVRVSLYPGERIVEDLRLGGSVGHLALSLAQRDSDLDCRLEVLAPDAQPLLTRLAPQRFPADFRLRGLRGRFDLSRGPGHFATEIDLGIEALQLGHDQPEISLSARGHLGDGRLRIEELRADAGQSRRLELTADLPLDVVGPELFTPGALELRGHVTLDEPTKWSWPGSSAALALAGGAALAVELHGEWSAVGGELRLDVPEATLAIGAGTARHSLGPFEARARLSVGPAIELGEFVLRSPPTVDVECSGNIGSTLDLRRLEREGAGAILDAPLALKSRFKIEDLSGAARLLDVRRLGGRLEGELDVAGSARARRIQGWAQVEDGELRLRGDVPTLQSLKARARFDTNTAELESLQAELGGGALTASGTCDWSGAQPELRFQIAGKELLVVQQTDLRVRADAEISISGPLDAARATGRVTIRDGRYTKNVEFLNQGRGTPSFEPGLTLFSIEQGPLSNLRFDINLASAQPIRIVNNIVRGAVHVDLHLGGTGRAPDLTGTLFIDPTRVLLPAAVLKSTMGTVELDRDSGLVPRLDLRFETRVQGYDVLIHVTGTTAAPEVEFSSVPPLTSEDLLAMVLTGKPPSTNWDGGASSEAARNIALFVGKDVLARWFLNDSDEGTSWLERVEWRTGANVTKSGAQTSELSLRLMGEERGAGRALYLRGEQDAYDTSNLGLRLVFRMR